MIPFWKKTEKSGKKKPPKPAVPRTAQQSIPMQRMFEDGTCRVKANYYTRTIAYQDINYQLAQQEDKTAIFEEWCSFLNFFDSSIKFELSFVNMATDSTEFEKSIRTGRSISLGSDGFQNDWRSFMSEKLDKLRATLKKEQERRIKLNNRIAVLERRIQEEEAAEVSSMVRTANVTPEQLAALLRQSAATAPNPAALSAVGATFEKEVDADED